MALIRFFKALGNLGFALQFYDEATLAFTETGTTSATMTDANGARVEFTGRDLSVDEDGTITGGKVTGIRLISAEGDLLTTVRQMHRDATDLWSAFETGGLLGVEFELIKADDEIIGSSVGDYMIGLGGDDLMDGKAGKDAFIGGKGSDTLTGGDGADLFYFVSFDKSGHDIITDFHATGPKSRHDRINLSAEDYASMVAVQDGTDVLITWAWGADLRLANTDLADLDSGDFLIG